MVHPQTKVPTMSTVQIHDTYIISIDDAIKLTTLSKSTIYRSIKNGDFPIPISITSNRSGFIYQEIIDWIRSRPRVLAETH